MQRFLLHLGYCGSRLRGVQKQLEEQEQVRSSVQGLLEKGLHHLCPAGVSQLTFSSRTDKGVHAVCNTAHVDLPSESEWLCTEPNKVTHLLNRFFKNINADIRIYKTTVVPPTFHSRYDAVARRYLYRLAVTPEPLSGSVTQLEQFMPIPEIGRLYLVRPPFDVEQLRSVCHLLEGTHDFASFGNAPAKGTTKTTTKTTVRKIHSISVTPGRPCLDPAYDPLYSQLQFWDVNVRASSFLYRQVRRTVGALVSVAQGYVTLKDIQHMLDEPSHGNWVSAAKVAPPDGLFLLNVEYPPHVFCDSGGHVEGEGKDEVDTRKPLDEDCER